MRQFGIDDSAIWGKIEDIVIKTLLSAEHILSTSFDMFVPYRNNCFEVLGFDVLIDSNLDPWLLEVNLSPSLSCDSPLDQKIKGNLLADLFTLSGIVPLEQRNAADARKQGLHYGVYMGKSDAPVAAPAKKVKRGAAPGAFDQRSGGATGYAASLLAKMGREEKIVMKESDDEHKRRGHFKRIFPNANYATYRAFFEEERPLNVMLDYRISMRRKSKQAALMQQMHYEQPSAPGNPTALLQGAP